MATIAVATTTLPAQVASGESSSTPAAREHERTFEILRHAGETRTILEAMAQIREAYPESRPAVLAALRNPAPHVRAFALRVLGEGNDKDDRPRIESALRDTHRTVRMAAVAALGAFGDSGVPALVLELPRERDPRVTCGILNALGRWADADVVPAIVRRLRKEEDATVLQTGFRILHKLTGRTASTDLRRWQRVARQITERKSLRPQPGDTPSNEVETE